ncbi:MAG: hypothetical protein KDJ65_14165, partial [Anaerolineae bacterium]|nr:hypothetical protein [Anaerolineae bacterium]
SSDLAVPPPPFGPIAVAPTSHYTHPVGATATSLPITYGPKHTNDVASPAMARNIRSRMHRRRPRPGARQSDWGHLFPHHRSGRLPSPLHNYMWPMPTSRFFLRLSLSLAFPHPSATT